MGVCYIVEFALQLLLFFRVEKILGKLQMSKTSQTRNDFEQLFKGETISPIDSAVADWEIDREHPAMFSPAQ